MVARNSAMSTYCEYTNMRCEIPFNVVEMDESARAMVIIGVCLAKAYPASMPIPTPFSVKSTSTISLESISAQPESVWFFGINITITA